MNLSVCLPVTLREEGSEFTDDPHDPGGPTRYGITLATLLEWRQSHADPDVSAKVTAEGVRNLTLAEATEIYRARYWNAVQGDQLPPGVDLCVFDFAVNSGPGRATRELQSIVNVTVDGGCGPVTVGAACRMDPAALIMTLSGHRLAFLQSLAGWRYYATNWGGRVTRIAAASQAMARAPAPAPEPVPVVIAAAAPPPAHPGLFALLSRLTNRG